MNPTFPSPRNWQLHPCIDPAILDYMAGESGLLLGDSIMHLQASQVCWRRQFIVHAFDAK